MTGSQPTVATHSLLAKLALVALLGVALFAAQAALRANLADAGAGAKFTVNRIGDGSDANVGNGICEVTAGQGDCTLRAAIQESNDDPDHNTINFDAGNFAELSHGIISLTSALPAIIHDLTIDAVDRGVEIDANGYPNGLLVDRSVGGATVNEFEVLGGGSTLEIYDASSDGINIRGGGHNFVSILIDGVDISDVTDDGIEIWDFENVGASTVTISNNEIDAGNDGVNITQDAEPIDSNTVKVIGNDIHANTGEAVDIEFNGSKGSGDHLTIEVDENVHLISDQDDGVDIEYCVSFDCGGNNSTVNISVSDNGQIQGGDEGVDIGVLADSSSFATCEPFPFAGSSTGADSYGYGDAGGVTPTPSPSPTATPVCSDNKDVTVHVDGNESIQSINSDGVRVDVTVCCETSDNTATVTVDDGGDITGSVDGVNVGVYLCCGSNNDASVSASNNHDITGQGDDGVRVDVFTNDPNNPVDESNIQTDVNDNHNILGNGGDGVSLHAHTGSGNDTADMNTIETNVNDNRDITGVGGRGVRIDNDAGSSDDDADNNSTVANVTGNRNIMGESGEDGVEIDQSAYGDAAGAVGNSTSATVSGNSNITGDDDGVSIGAFVCCDGSNQNHAEVSENADITGINDDGIDIGGSPNVGGPWAYLCCSQNTVDIKDNTGTITGGDFGIEMFSCGDPLNIDVDTDCLADSTTILVVDNNDISESGSGGIAVCCGDFGDPQGDLKDDRSVIRNNTISYNGGPGVAIFNASGIQTGPDNVIDHNDSLSGIDIIELDLSNPGSPEADGNTITQNSIFDNDSLGIDLEGDGNITSGTCNFGPNSDPNNCLKIPTLLLVNNNKVTGVGCGNCEIEVYRVDDNPANNEGGSGVPHGEGVEYLGTAMAGVNGAWSLPLCDVAGPIQLTALQTNANGDSSEFAENIDFPGTSEACPTDTPTNTNTPGTATNTPTNTPVPTTGSIEVCKDTNPETTGDPVFDFDTDIPGMTDPDLADGDCDIETGVDPDSYTITENAVDGWVLDEIDCTGTASSNIDTDIAAAEVVIDLHAGDDVSCLFTNVDISLVTASINICKETDPADTGATFDFETDLPDAGDFSLEDGDCVEDTEVTPGDYTILEVAQDGWNLTDIACTGTDEANLDISLDPEQTVVVSLQEGEDVECVFTNEAKPTPTPTTTPTPTATTEGPATPTNTPTATNTPPVATPGNVIGDVNKNGVINAIDAQLILQSIAFPNVFQLAHPKNADVNEDGVVNAVDALLIQQFVAALIPSLPV